MKIKKLLSLISAAAISASCFAGMAISANAADSITAATTWDMSAWSDAAVTGTSAVTIRNLTYYTDSKSGYASGDKEFTEADGTTTKWTGRVKLGGASTIKTDSLIRVFAFTPGVSGTVTAYVQHGGSDGTRTVYLTQTLTATNKDTDAATAKVETVDGGIGILTGSVSANSTAYIWADANVGVYAIKFTPSSEGGDDTETPASETPASETPASETPAVSVSVTPKENVLYSGQSTTLSAAVANAEDTSVTWAIEENEGIASIDKNGKVSARAQGGPLTVTATSNADSSAKDTATITVAATAFVTPSGDDVSALKAAAVTTTYDILAAAETAKGENAAAESGSWVYETGKLYFNDEIAAVGNNANFYQQGKSTTDVDGTTTNTNGVRLKTDQDVFAIKLATGATITTYVTGGGGSSRYATLSTAIGSDGDLVKSDDLASYATGKVEYTNNTSAEQTVYLSATGDSFFSQVRVTVPEAEEPATPDFKIELGDAEVVHGTGNLADTVASAYIATITNDGAEGTLGKITVTVDEHEQSSNTKTITLAEGGEAYIGLVLANVNADTQSVSAAIE